MNYTDNYSLPQWEEEDRIQMADFNGAMENIDAGMAANAQRTEEVAAALPYVIGSYTGNETAAGVTVNLGFKPKFLIISGQTGGTSPTAEYTILFGMAGPLNSPGTLSLTSSGFHVTYTNGAYPRVNLGGIKYDYIAFK
jgi:hypothetical protein